MVYRINGIEWHHENAIILVNLDARTLNPERSTASSRSSKLPITRIEWNLCG